MKKVSSAKINSARINAALIIYFRVYTCKIRCVVERKRFEEGEAEKSCSQEHAAVMHSLEI